MKSSQAPVMGAAEWVLLLALSAIWGGSFFLGKVALSGLPPLTGVTHQISRRSASP